ncbi:MAG: hypothetical protein LBC20_15460 [Planctomycetaceae bacterium]|jgi:hypothetical protein|nr:hypothetical protein [Planctomycetaceae bacterium]
MENKVDMKYSFFSEEEPTEEQLECLMREVAEEAKETFENTLKKYEEKMKVEIALMREQRQKLREK